MAILRGHRGEVISASFEPDGRRAVSGGDDGTVGMGSRQEGAVCGRSVGIAARSSRAVFSPTAEADRQCGGGRHRRGQRTRGPRSAGGPAGLGCAFLSLRSTPMVGGSQWAQPMETYHRLGATARRSHAARSPGPVQAVRFSPKDGSRLVERRLGGWLRVRNLETGGGRERLVHRGGVMEEASIQDGRTIVSAGLDAGS